MLLKRFDTPIEEVDLQWLIDFGLPESKTLEYKRQIPEPNDNGKVKFLKTISAFANTDGGDLIFGIDSENGIAKKFAPIEKSDVDTALLRLESTIASSTEPRISGVSLQHIALSCGGSAIVARVQKSWNSPHRVIVGNHSHFYGRNSAGCYAMDTSELRRAFTMAYKIADRAGLFRSERFAEYTAYKFPVAMDRRVKIAIHIMPLSSLMSDKKIDGFDNKELLRKLAPPGSNNYSCKYNINGWISFSQTDQGASSAFTQLYRNGRIEAVFTPNSPLSNEKIIYPWYEEIIIEFLEKSFATLIDLDVLPPAYIAISVLDAWGYSLVIPNRINLGNSITEAASFIVPEVQIDDFRRHPAHYMRDSFDSVWNAFGHEKSANFNSDGAWSPPV